MRRLFSAELIRYNANTRGTRTTDCTARAISLAFNINYSAARKLLNDSAKSRWDWNYNTHDNCIKVIKELGGGNLIKTEKISVADFADAHLSGTYIIWCSENGVTDKGNHLVTIIDGKIYDTWDSTKYFVKGYWEVNVGVKGTDVSDIRPLLKEHFITTRNAKWYSDYTSAIFNRIVTSSKKMKQLESKFDYDIDLKFTLLEIKLRDYALIISYQINISYEGTKIPDQQYSSKAVIAFNPTIKPEQFDAYFDKTFYDKFYPFLYDMIVKIQDTCEGYELTQKSDNEYHPYFYDKGEEKSFRALPYWVRALTTSFTLERPDRYFGKQSDSVRITMHRAPFDKEYDPSNPNDKIRFEAYDMSELREILQHYKSTGDYESSYNIRYDY